MGERMNIQSKFIMSQYDMELKNKQKGYHFFDTQAKRFFKSRISDYSYSNDGLIYYFWSKEDSGFIPPITKKYSLR